MKLLFFLFVTLLALHAESIDAYHVNISILDDGSLHVREQIDYDFGMLERHGIFRDIPLTVTSSRGSWDIGLSDYATSMDGGFVPLKISTKSSQNSGEMVHLQIGSPDTTVSGKHRYVITYSVAQGIFGMADGRDAIRWNAIGTQWQIPINNVTISITIPQKLQETTIVPATYSGIFGSTNTGGTIRRTDNATFEASIEHLRPYEGFTVELAYPKDLLTPPPKTATRFVILPASSWQYYSVALFTLVLVTVWWRYGKEDAIGPIMPQYELPKDMTALRAGLLIDQSADNKDFAAAIIELAQRGYLDIRKEHIDFQTLYPDLTEKNLRWLPQLKKKHTILVRTDKEVRGLPLELQMLLNEVLFTQSDRFVVDLRSNSRAERIQEKYNDINTELYTWSMLRKGYIADNPEKIRKKFTWLSLLVALPMIGYGFYETLQSIPQALIVSVAILIFSSFLISPFKDFKTHGFNIGTIITLLFLLMSLFLFYFFLSKMSLDLDKIPWDFEALLYPFPFLMLMLTPIFILRRYMGRFTSAGIEAYRHIAGYQEFIKRVKRDEIERYLKEDPLFLERALPYAMVFGMTKHWLAFYDLAHVAHPAWYHDNDMDSLESLGDSLASMAETVSNSSGGGGSSGGGSSSGGGGGGGGGGSW